MKKNFLQVTSEFKRGLQQVIDTNYRGDIDKFIHVVDLSYSALLVNKISGDTDESFNQLYLKYIETLERYINSKGIPIFKSIDEINNEVPVYLVKTTGIYALVGNPIGSKSGFDQVQVHLSNISKSNKLKGSRFGYTESRNKKTGLIEQKTLTEIGHTPSSAGSQTSPLDYRLNELDIITQNNPVINNVIKQQIAKLHAIQADIEYTFRNETPELLNFKNAILSGKVGSFFISVSLHNRKTNNKISVLEAKIDRYIREFVSNLEIMDIIGSNTIREDLTQVVIEEIKSTLLGKRVNSLKPHTPKTLKEVFKVSAGTVKVSGGIKLPQLRTKMGQFYSLANLQVLLNQHLNDQISNNMGNGERRDILNYRTGRFAGSAKVDKLVQSREGMITAFYTYMKYPYATFSVGGRQQIPHSRDPKLLISKSIREIASAVVGNRLRAVLI